MDKDRANQIASDFISTMNNNGKLDTRIKTYEFDKNTELDLQYEFNPDTDKDWCICTTLRDKETEDIIFILTCNSTDSVQMLADVLLSYEGNPDLKEAN